MVSEKPGIGRRTMGWVKKHPRISSGALAFATATGLIHHANPNLEGPVGTVVNVTGTVPDVVGSAVVGFLNPTDSKTPDQTGIEYAKEQVETFFQANSFLAGGQIEIDLASLSEARTREIQLAIRLGEVHDNFDPGTVESIKISDEEFPAVPGLRIAIDNPVGVDNGLGKYYLITVETKEGAKQDLVLPNDAVYTSRQGNFLPLGPVTDDFKLEDAHQISPAQ
jgi:hypothetical protein